MKHVMIDLETLGTSADSVFLSVAALQFDLKGNVGNEFSMNVELDSAMRMGRKIQASTLQWWLEQRPEILKLMFKSPQDITTVLGELEWFIRTNALEYPWGNSASFDLGMLSNAYTSIGAPLPWKHYNERCYRTAWALTSKGLTHAEKPKDAHNPLTDCHYQVSELARLELFEI